MDIRHAAQLLGGVVSAGRILCPGPGHSRHDRSLSVRVSPDAPDGFMVTSFANDDWQDCKDFVRSRLGLEQFRPGERRPEFKPRFERPVEPTEDETRNTERALTIWGETVPIHGTPAATYLAGRRVPYDRPALRWHPSCPFGRDRVGCMVALVRNILTDEPQAIHRTAINRDGSKLSHLGSNGRLALGSNKGGAVKLTPDEDVSTALGIGEGIETVLSLPLVADVPGLPVWSLLSAGPLGDFPVLSGIESLWIAVDHDDAGIIACRKTTARWMATDRPVIHAAAETHGADLNTLLCEVA